MGTAWAPCLDLVDADQASVLRVEVPGVHKENLHIELTGNLLTISACHDGLPTVRVPKVEPATGTRTVIK